MGPVRVLGGGVAAAETLAGAGGVTVTGWIGIDGVDKVLVQTGEDDEAGADEAEGDFRDTGGWSVSLGCICKWKRWEMA